MDLITWRRRILRGSHLPLTARLVGMAIADYANIDGTSSYPTNGRLADDLEVTPRTIKRAIEALRTNGWLADRMLGGRRHFVFLVPRGTSVTVGGDTTVPPGGTSPSPNQTSYQTTEGGDDELTPEEEEDVECAVYGNGIESEVYLQWDGGGGDIDRERIADAIRAVPREDRHRVALMVIGWGRLKDAMDPMGLLIWRIQTAAARVAEKRTAETSDDLGSG